MESFDFIIIGAGLSGIDAAYRLKTWLPNCTYTVLEARDRMGGTWSFFQYPGIRSDSQLPIFAFPWRPWLHDRVIADGQLILDYIESAARDEGVDKKIQFSHRITGANWSSQDQQWILRIDGDGAEKTYRTTFVLACTGYYDYQRPLEATIPGIDKFQGVVAHPQFWPKDLNFANKRVVLVGSGATAITMLPAIAETAGHVTMLQRSPSYVFSIKSRDVLGAALRRYLPGCMAAPLNWWCCFLLEQLFIYLNVTFPSAARRFHKSMMKKRLPESVPVDVHFNPLYKPMEQRLCLSPDGDFFKALHQPNCDIVTDIIDTVATDGLLTKSGLKLDADIIVTATGLHVQLFGGVIPTVDGVPVDIGNAFAWRGTMLSGVPNCGAVIGYTRSSWTMGADMSIRLLIQVYEHMKKIGATSAVPVFDGDASTTAKPLVDHSSTYFVHAQSRLPRVTGHSPWYGRTGPIYDAWQLWTRSLTKGMKYTMPPKKEN